MAAAKQKSPLVRGLFVLFLPCAYRSKVQKNMGQPVVDAGTSHWSSWVPEVKVEPARWVIGRPSELEADSQPSLDIGSD